MILGLDYGAINIKNSKGQSFENKIKNDELVSITDSIIIDGNQYIFGKGEYDFSQDVKFKQERFLPLVFASICNVDTHENNFDIVMGLPIKHYKKYKEELIKLIQDNRSKEVIFNGTTRNININNIEVFPEGLGILYSLTDEELSKFDKRDLLIIDIGGSTTDIALLNGSGLNREIIKTHSASFGMNEIFNDIKEYISNNTDDESITIEKAQQILESKVIHSVNGVDTNLDFINDIKLNLVMKILKDMKLKFADSLKSSSWLVCGGGAKYLFPYFKHIQPNAIENQSIFANAKGYEKVGVFKWQR